MRKLNSFSVVVLVASALGLLAVHALTVFADPLSFSGGAAANMARPCSHKGITTEAVTSSTTHTTATARTVGAVVMVICRNKAWMAQGASNVTAASDGTNAYLVNDTPYWFLTETSGNYFAFVKVSGETDSTCYVTECR